jgi:hypothetical protein
MDGLCSDTQEPYLGEIIEDEGGGMDQSVRLKGFVHFRILLHVRNRSDGDTEVRRRTPEIYAR